MTTTTDRRCLMLGGVAALPVTRLSAATPAAPDLIVHNARITTMDAARRTARALAVQGDRFVAVGDDDVRSLAGSRTRVVDAKGMAVLPGFIDCHNHAFGEALLTGVLVGNPFEVEFVTIASIIDKLKARAATTPADTWVEGEFYDDTKVKDGRLITIDDLDKVSRTHPVVVNHRGGHTGFYNSRAFELAGITRDTPDPPGGTFDRFPDGRLNGRVTDTAMTMVERAGQRPVLTPAEAAARGRRAAAHISQAFARYGLTSVHHQGGDLAALQAIRAAGDLRHRVNYEAYQPMLDAMIANGLATGFGDDWIRLGATAEHTVDGSFSERTMALSVPYPGRSPPYKGNVTTDQASLDAWVERMVRGNIQPNCHANGDVAIAMVLSAFERAQRLTGRKDIRPKITHCTLINDDLVRRIKATGAIPTPFTSYAYYNPDKFKFYGQDLMARAMAFRSFLDAGIPACAGSDFQPGPFAPLMGIQGMVTRTGWNGEVWGPNQKVSVAEAIRINTLNGAHASFEDADKGSITAGKLADYVMLADDPASVDPSRIKDIAIVETVCGGRTTWRA